MLQVGEPCLLIELPAIGQPRGEVAVGRDRQVNHQLCEIELGIDIVPPTGRS